MSNVRQSVGVPAASAFAGFDGSPVVLDVTNGRAYGLKSDGTVFAIGCGYGYCQGGSLSGTGSTVTMAAGSFDVNGTLVPWTSPLTLNVGTLAASTLYYVYLTTGGALEKSTTVPVFDATLNYWKKTGDATRRCVGHFWSTSTSALAPFAMDKVSGTTRTRRVVYTEQLAAAGEHPFSGSTVAWVAESLSDQIPANAIRAVCQGYVLNTLGTAQDCGFSINGSSPVYTSDSGSGDFSIYVLGLAGGATAPFLTAEIVLLNGATLYISSWGGSSQADAVASAAVTGVVIEI